MLAAMLALFLVLAQAAAPVMAEEVDVAIVLAVDCSASVDADEFDLQMRGLAWALQQTEVLTAIAELPNGTVAVSVVQWSSFGEQAIIRDWSLIRSRRDAAAVAAAVRHAPRLFGKRGTAIADLIDYARRYLGRLPFAAGRRLIDISGDGKNNQPPLMREARARAVAAGITVNGLPIVSADPVIDLYYRDSVIAGPGSFIEIADGYENFGRAMKRKLVREIRGDPVVSMRGE